MPTNTATHMRWPSSKHHPAPMCQVAMVGCYCEARATCMCAVAARKHPKVWIITPLCHAVQRYAAHPQHACTLEQG